MAVTPPVAIDMARFRSASMPLLSPPAVAGTCKFRDRVKPLVTVAGGTWIWDVHR
jgi:hypothetical protein